MSGKALPIQMVEEFLSLEFPPKEPLIEGLLHKRDQVTFAGRRRHGKTSFLIDLCVAGATGREFIGYETHEFRSLAFLLEDDPGELQDKLRPVVGESDLGARVAILHREDFLEAKISISVLHPEFWQAVQDAVSTHSPDLIVFDNLAHLIGARYNDAEIIHKLMMRIYRLAAMANAAVIIAAHPRKEDRGNPVRLDQEPDSFFEEVMGSSHLVNSTGSLWGIQRQDDYSIFLGGRQRAEGRHAYTVIQQLEDGRFTATSDSLRAIDLVIHTDKRREAWELLPDPPETFSYSEGRALVQSALSSSSSYYEFMCDLRRNNLVVEVEGALHKVPTPVGWR